MKIFKILFVLFLMMSLNISVHAQGYGVGPNKKGERPNVYDSAIIDNNGYTIGPDNKNIYLTFDCGYENGYTEAMLDVLKETNTKAIFFITGHYLTSSRDLVKRMIDDGHLIGNHTYFHKDFTVSTKDEILNDVKKLEEAFYNEFGTNMSKFVRPPRGEYNSESQRVLAENGYTSVFWSLAYVDWYKDKFNGNDYSYNKVMNKIHNGAIILMHTVSKDNMVDLRKIIDKLNEEGYVFSRVDML